MAAIFTDRAIGVALGIVLGVAIVVAFVFFGSGETIDAPSLSGDQPATETTVPSTPPTGTQP